MAKELVDNEEVVQQYLDAAQEYFDAFRSDREDVEDDCEVADYMYKAAQNRTLASADKTYGANLDDDERANTGSTLFFRMCNQRAAVGASVTLSQDMPFKYDPIINEMVFASADEADEMANQANIEARWTMKKDRFKQKVIEFWNQLAKYSNVPVMVYWKERKATRKINIDIPIVEQDANGEEIITGYDQTTIEKEYTVEAYPCLKLMPWSSLYADRWIGEINDGNCVIVQSFTNYAAIAEGVRSGYYSENALDEILEERTKYTWDGSTGKEFLQEQMDNQNHTMSSTKASDQFLQWDVYMRSPIEKNKWDDEAVPVWYWATIIGNDIKNGKMIRLERNPDPDDEVPIKMVSLFPDDSDSLYHVMMSQILRSNYSVECTLKNQAIDNISMVNNPPIAAVEGMHRVRDFRFKQGAFWPVDDINAIKEFPVRDTTQSTAGLLQLIEGDSMRAAQLGPSQMDEFAGARTSASEAIAVNRNSLQPQLMQVRYVLEQLLPWYARKLRSYWQEFASPEQILRLTDEPKYNQVKPKDIYGEFDVEVNIVDEYESSVVEMQKLSNVLMTLAGAPALLQSPTHQVDVGELVRRWLEKQKISGVGKIVLPAKNVDSARIARLENLSMIEGGQYDRPQPGEAHQIHLSEHEGERIRWQGIEDANPNVALLDQHIAETRMLLQQEQGQGVANAPVGPQNQTEGQAVGNEMAGALGAMA